MSKFLEINVVEFSRDHFGDATRYGDDEAHLLVIKAAKTHYINIDTIDMVTPVKRTIKDDNDQDVEVDSTYFHIHFEGAAEETSRHVDRDSWILVDGLATDWLEKIADAVAEPEPEPVEDDGLKITDRGVWLPGETYYRFDLVGNPDDVSEKYLALKESQSTSPAILQNSKEFCSV